MAPEKTHIEPAWCVHVLGPDDVLVQPDRATAVREAHALNAWVASKSDAELNDPMNPTIWAVVTTLGAPGVVDRQHDPLTAIDDIAGGSCPDCGERLDHAPMPGGRPPYHHYECPRGHMWTIGELRGTPTSPGDDPYRGLGVGGKGGGY